MKRLFSALATTGLVVAGIFVNAPAAHAANAAMESCSFDTRSATITATEGADSGRVDVTYTVTPVPTDGDRVYAYLQSYAGGELWAEYVEYTNSSSSVVTAPAWSADLAGETFVATVYAATGSGTSWTKAETVLCSITLTYDAAGPAELDSITSSCTFNDTANLVVNANSSTSTYSIRFQGAGIDADPKTYVAWLEIHTSLGIFGEGGEAEVSGDSTADVTYTELATAASVFGPSFTYKYFPAEYVDGSVSKVGVTSYCSITFNVSSGSGKNFGKAGAPKATDPKDRERENFSTPPGKAR